MFASPAAPVAAAKASAVHFTLAEQVNELGLVVWRHFARLDAREAAFNLLTSGGAILVAWLLIWGLRRVFDRWLVRFERAAGEDPAKEAKATTRAAGVTWSLIRLVTVVCAALVVLSVWGIDPWTWLAGGAGAKLLHLAIIAVLATALVEVAGFVIRQFVEGFASRSGNPRRAAQLRTLGPLLIGSVQGVLIVIGLLTFLSELGIKVGPLLASAGVVGVAIGFGAQTIVKDFLTGLFLIAEDVVSVGDNVRIGTETGVVEIMTVRTIRLRSADGTLHIFPYSEAQVVHNHTKVFSSYLFEVVVNYECDLDQALAVMQRVGDGLRADPAYKRLITRPFEVLGVDKLGAAGVTLKARVTTEPKAQWEVGREYNRRLKAAFDAAGIGTALQQLGARAPTDPPRPPAPDGRAAQSAASQSNGHAPG